MDLKRELDEAIYAKEQRIAALHKEREKLKSRLAQVNTETETIGAQYSRLTQARLTLVAYSLDVQRAAEEAELRGRIIKDLELPAEILPYVGLFKFAPNDFRSPDDYTHFAEAFDAIATIYIGKSVDADEEPGQAETRKKINGFKEAALALVPLARKFGHDHESTILTRDTLLNSLKDAIGTHALRNGSKVIESIATPIQKPAMPSEADLVAARDALQGNPPSQKS